jgi:hypothetical protein
MVTQTKIGCIEGKRLMKELSRFKRCYRLQFLIGYLSWGTALAIVLVLSSYIYKIIIYDFHIPVWVFALPILSAVILSLFKPVKLNEFVLNVDRRLGLKERLLTSIYVLNGKSTYSTLLLQDTLNHMQISNPRLLFPVKWSRAILLFTALIVALLVYNFHNISYIKPPNTLHIADNTNIVIKEEGERVNKFAEKLKQSSLFSEPGERVIIQKLENLGNKMRIGNLDKREALLMLSDLSSSVRENLDSKGTYTHALDNDDPDYIEKGIRKNDLNTGREILDSLARAKRRIAEAVFSTDQENKEYLSGRASDLKTYSGQETMSEEGGIIDDLSLREGSSSTGTGASQGRVVTDSRHKKSPLNHAEYRSDKVILKYLDSVIPIESLPERYHTIVKKYFDAISNEK